jgi:multidrug efflux system membrane fusion protein
MRSFYDTVPQLPPRWRFLRWPLILLAALLLIWLGWLLFGSSSKSNKHPAEQAVPVGVAKVDTGDMHVVLTGIGTVTPLATITVQTQINGQLMSVGFTEGQLVNKGDVLAQIDPRPYEISLQQAEGALAHDSALLAQAKSDLARYVELAQKNSIAKQQVADQGFLVQQDQGMVTEDEAAIATAKLNLTYCRIVSPVTGRVGLRLVDPGNYVQTSGSTGLVVVAQLQPISLVFVLPEDSVPDMAQAFYGNQTLYVTAYDRTNANMIEIGTLTAVDNTVDTTTGTVKLRATFQNAKNALFPNEFVNAHLLIKTLSNVTRVPVAAVQQGAPGTFVYLVKQSSTAEKKDGPGDKQDGAADKQGNGADKQDSTVAVQVVTTGVTDGDEIQIVSGVKAGDTVVVDGADQLKDGAKIKIAPPAKPSNANSGPGAPPGQQNQGKQ